MNQAKYAAYLASPHWKSTRLRKLRTAVDDGFGHYMCQGCGMFVWTGAIEVHHLTYDRLGSERLEDLKILCEGCHASAHGKTPPRWWLRCKEEGLIDRPYDRETLRKAIQGLLELDPEMDREDVIRKAIICCVPRVTKYDVQVLLLAPRNQRMTAHKASGMVVSK